MSTRATFDSTVSEPPWIARCVSVNCFNLLLTLADCRPLFSVLMVSPVHKLFSFSPDVFLILLQVLNKLELVVVCRYSVVDKLISICVLCVAFSYIFRPLPYVLFYNGFENIELVVDAR